MKAVSWRLFIVVGALTFGACSSGTREGAAPPAPPEASADIAAAGYPEPPSDPTPERGSMEYLLKAPTFTPYTVRPDIKNRREVAEALAGAYPPDLKEAGIGGTAQVWFLIDGNGVVRKTQIDKSSGHLRLDEAALRVARVVEFTPALNEGEAVPAWISLPITFTTR
jgi:protein TonB